MKRSPEHLDRIIEPLKYLSLNKRHALTGVGLFLMSLGAIDLSIDGNNANLLYNQQHPNPISAESYKVNLKEYYDRDCDLTILPLHSYMCEYYKHQLDIYKDQQTTQQKISQKYHGFLPNVRTAYWLSIYGFMTASMGAVIGVAATKTNRQ